MSPAFERKTEWTSFSQHCSPGDTNRFSQRNLSIPGNIIFQLILQKSLPTCVKDNLITVEEIALN
jgi:hypothetical protein